MASIYEERGIGTVVDQKYNEGVKGLGGKLSGGVKQVAGSGFGKGALVMAGVVLGGAALFFGLTAGAGMLTVAGHAATHVTVGSGLRFGISFATNFLTHALGLATLAIGGVIGTLVQPKRISPAQAQALAAGYERSRQPELAQQLVQEMPAVADNVAENKWQMAELKRRATRNPNNPVQTV